MGSAQMERSSARDACERVVVDGDSIHVRSGEASAVNPAADA
jgi:hypothetical protein